MRNKKPDLLDRSLKAFWDGVWVGTQKECHARYLEGMRKILNKSRRHLGEYWFKKYQEDLDKIIQEKLDNLR